MLINNELSELEKAIFEERQNCENHWFNKSSDLHASAAVLWYSLEDDEELKNKLGFSKGFSLAVACYPTYKLLVALSIELLLKAIIVAKRKKPKAIHDLNILSQQAELEISEEEKMTFQLLSEIIYWEGKYPVPNNGKRLFKQWNLWNSYFSKKHADNSEIQQQSIEETIEWENTNKIYKELMSIYFEFKETQIKTNYTSA